MKTLQPSTDGRYISEIDGLRALSVILVLLFHLDIEFFSGGFIGVDVFFVISGFLITRNISSQLQSGRFNLKKFYIARVRRLFPALLATLAVTFLVSVLVMSPLALQSLAMEVVTSLFSVSNIYFWMESGYFEVESATRPLLHTWSLGVEEQFYLIYPIVFVFLASRFTDRKVFIILGLILIINLTVSQLAITVDPSASFYLFVFRIFEFLIGAMIVIFRPIIDGFVSSKIEIIKEFLFAFCLGMIILTSIYYDSSTSFSGINALIPCIAAAGLLVSLNAKLGQYLFGGLFVTYLGRISYSIYLVHWPIIVLTKYITDSEFTVQQQVILFLASLIGGSILHRFVEMPFRYPSLERVGAVSNKRFLKGFAASVILVSTSATYAVLDGGWSWRLGQRASEGSLGIDDPSMFHTKYYGGVGCNSLGCETSKDSIKQAVYVLGDSHARALFTGLKAHFPEVNFIVAGPNSCAMYTETYGYHQTKYDEFCEASKKNLFAKMKAQPGPIIFHSHWLARMSSTHYSKSGELSKSFENSFDYSLFLKKSLVELSNDLGSHNVLVLGGLPRYMSSLSPLDCMTRPLASDRCTYGDRDAKIISGQDELSSIMGEVLRDDFDFINIYDYLCDQDQCLNLDESGYPIYSDTTHLSVWGSTFLIAKLKTRIANYVSNDQSASQ